LTELNAAVVGVSRDDAAAQKKFADGQGLPYPLVPDVDGAVGKALGVPSVAGFYRRVTILVAPDGRVARVIDDVDVRRHAEQVAAAIRTGR
jgi:peroxiredoxin Q/BCP